MGRPYQGGLHHTRECAKITLVLGKDYKGQNCSVAATLELIGERWSLLVLRDVFSGRRRFEQIQRANGIASNVLTARLQRLVDEGILERRPYSWRPPRYEYFLTEKGLDLWPVLIAIMGWGDRHLSGDEGPPVEVLHKGECGGRVNDRGICEACGKVLSAREARAVERAPVVAAA
jgi:DNA-binding HxlR family transcriptional regulator